MLEVSSLYPRMLAKTPQQYRNLIKVANGKKNVFRSVYHFDLKNGMPDYNSIIINQVYFDFDECDKSYPEVQQFIRNLYENKIKFRINFSGRGFHVYVATGHKNIDRKTYLNMLFQHIINKYNLTLVDPITIGNIKQLRRIENTLNIKNDLYCIPLTYWEALYLTINEIKELAEVPRSFDSCWIDGNEIKLDGIDINTYNVEKSLPSGNGEFKEIDDILPDPCMVRILHSCHPNHNERYLLCVWLSYHFRGGTDINDFDLTALCEKIIAFMRTRNWHDYSEALNTAKSTRYQVYNIINKKHNFVPNCSWRRIRGICCSEECWNEKSKIKENYI